MTQSEPILPNLEAPSRWRDGIAFMVMLSGGLCMAIIFTAIAPILSAAALHFGGGARGDMIAQLIMTMPDIGIIVGGPLAGLLVERWGARTLLLVALALFGVTGSMGFFIDEAWTLLASRLALGFAGAGIATSTTALIGERLIGHARVRALGYWSAVGAGGGVVSVLLAGGVAEAGGWHAPFLMYATALVLMGLALFSIPAQPRSNALASAAEKNGSVLTLWPLYAWMVPVYVVVFMTGVQVSFLLAENGVVSPSVQSWVIGSASFGSMIGAASYGWLRQWLGQRWMLVVSMTLLAAGNIVMGSVLQPALTAIGCVMNGMGGGMANPYFAELLIARAPLPVRGRALGLMYTMMFLGEFANPFVVTPLRIGFGTHNTFVIIGIVTAAALIYPIITNRKKRDEVQRIE